MDARVVTVECYRCAVRLGGAAVTRLYSAPFCWRCSLWFRAERERNEPRARAAWRAVLADGREILGLRDAVFVTTGNWP